MTTKTITSFEQLAAESQHVNNALIKHLLEVGNIELACAHLQRTKVNAQLTISYADHLLESQCLSGPRQVMIQDLKAAAVEVLAAAGHAAIIAKYEAMLTLLDHLCATLAPKLTSIVYEAV